MLVEHHGVAPTKLGSHEGPKNLGRKNHPKLISERLVATHNGGGIRGRGVP